jgi:ribulose-phosphate 3-epimerase
MINEKRTDKQRSKIDGGMTLENAGSIVKAGADVLVAGSTVFKSADPKATISQLKHIIA